MPTSSEYLLLARNLRDAANTASLAANQLRRATETLGIGDSPISTTLLTTAFDSVTELDDVSNRNIDTAETATQRARVCAEYTNEMAIYRWRYSQWIAEDRSYQQRSAAGIAVGIRPHRPTRPERPAAWVEEG